MKVIECAKYENYDVYQTTLKDDTLNYCFIILKL